MFRAFLNRVNPLWCLLLAYCSRRQQSIPHNKGQHRHLKGGLICEDLKLFSERQHYWRAWHWRQRFRLKSPSTSAFHPFVHTAITTMRLTPARPMDFMGRVTSTAASSWAWVPGQAGATATAGVAIASAMAAEEAIVAAAARQPVAAVMRVAVGQFARTAVVRLTTT